MVENFNQKITKFRFMLQNSLQHQNNVLKPWKLKPPCGQATTGVKYIKTSFTVSKYMYFVEHCIMQKCKRLMKLIFYKKKKQERGEKLIGSLLEIEYTLTLITCFM